MSTILFVSLVRGSQLQGYEATFPDIPDCSARGGDLPQLLTAARQALTLRLEAFEAAGEAWPSPTPIEQISAEPGAMPIPIDVAVDDPPVRVNVSLGERLVQRLDAAAEARGMTRSGFIAQSVRVSLGETARGAADEGIGRRLQDEVSTLARRINESLGPESAFGRRMNELDGFVYDGVRKAADGVSAAMARRRDAAKSETPGASEPNEA